MNAVAPIPSLIPDNAPFSSEQRAWLNGFFAAYLGIDGTSTNQAEPVPAESDEDFPGTMRRWRWPNGSSLPGTASPNAG